MVNVNKHKDKANDTERNTAMRAKMKNNYKNINNKVYPLSRTFLSNRQTVTVTFPADNFLFPIGCMK